MKTSQPRPHPLGDAADHKAHLAWAAQELELLRMQFAADERVRLAEIGAERWRAAWSWVVRGLIAVIIVGVYAWSFVGITGALIDDPDTRSSVENFLLWIGAPGVVMTVYVLPRLFNGDGRRRRAGEDEETPPGQA